MAEETTHCKEINVFDNWIDDNYHELQKYCKLYKIEEDLLLDTYLNIRDRISRSGFTQTYFKTYILTALRNLQINESKKLKNKYFIDYHDENFTNCIENKLQDINDEENDTAIYRDDIIYLSKMLFKFIMDYKKYNEEWQFIFRSYYLMPNRFTYAKLHKMTGVDKSKCTRIIRTIKNDIRNEFLTWLKNVS